MIRIGRALRIAIAALAAIAVGAVGARAAQKAEAEKMFEEDVIKTETGDLKITFLGHASLMFAYQGKVLYVDPVGNPSGTPVDYSKMPKADIILITHEHFDHLDPKAISVLRKEQTKIVLTKACAEKVSGGTVMKNGDVLTVQGIKIEAVPAYNIVQKRPDGQPFHPKGSRQRLCPQLRQDPRLRGRGHREHSRDEATEEHRYCLPADEPALHDDARDGRRRGQAFEPKILYPYHYGSTDPNKLVDLLKDSKRRRSASAR